MKLYVIAIVALAVVAVAGIVGWALVRYLTLD